MQQVEPKLREQLTERIVGLFRQAYPNATPHDAFNWRLKVTGRGYTIDWGVKQYAKGIKHLEDLLRKRVPRSR